MSLSDVYILTTSLRCGCSEEVFPAISFTDFLVPFFALCFLNAENPVLAKRLIWKKLNSVQPRRKRQVSSEKGRKYVKHPKTTCWYLLRKPCGYSHVFESKRIQKMPEEAMKEQQWQDHGQGMYKSLPVAISAGMRLDQRAVASKQIQGMVHGITVELESEELVSRSRIRLVPSRNARKKLANRRYWHCTNTGKLFVRGLSYNVLVSAGYWKCMKWSPNVRVSVFLGFSKNVQFCLLSSKLS